MKILNLLIVIPFLLFGSKVEAKSVPSLTKELVEGLTSKLEVGNLDVTIGSFTLEKSNFSSPFGLNLGLYLAEELKTHPQDFATVKRQSPFLTRGLIALDGEETAPAKTTPVKLEGQYRVAGSQVFLSARLVTRSGKKIAEHEVQIPKSDIPWPLKPKNFKVARAQQKTMEQVAVQPKKGTPFQIRLEINKGSGGIYKNGEPLLVYFKTTEDCFLKVLYLDASGAKTLLYPTERDPKSKMMHGVSYSLHLRNHYKISPPFGAEIIFGVCSQNQIPLSKVTTLGGGYQGFRANQSLKTIVKDLRGVDVQGQKAEATLYLTTVN